MVAMDRGKYYVAGKLTGLNRPVRDFFCKTPAETREDLPKGVDVVAFQCRNPIHRAHYEVQEQFCDRQLVAWKRKQISEILKSGFRVENASGKREPTFQP